MSVWEDMCRPVSEEEGQEIVARVISDVLSGRSDGQPCACGAPAESHPAWGAVPQQTAPYVIYAFFAHDGECLYVGQTNDLARRVSTHRHNYELFAFHADEVRIIAGCETRAEAHRLERANIRRLKPIFNIVHSTERGFNDPRALTTVVSGRRAS